MTTTREQQVRKTAKRITMAQAGLCGAWFDFDAAYAELDELCGDDDLLWGIFDDMQTRGF